MPNNEIADRKFCFVLSEKCLFIHLSNSDDIEFRVEADEIKKLLTGFSITVKHSTEDVAEQIAKQKAIVLTNIITVKYGRYVYPLYHGYTKILKDGKGYVKKSFIIGTGSRIRELSLDLKDKKISRQLNDMVLNQLYDHACRGFKAYQEYDAINMIKEFYQIVENRHNIPEELSKFKHLRDILSHKGPLFKETVNRVKGTFGDDYFVFIEGKYFDYTSYINKRLLYNEALFLMNKAVCYL
jgi:hypothetical protein